MYQQRKQLEFVDQMNSYQSSQSFSLNLSADHKQKLQLNKQSGLLNEQQLQKLAQFLEQPNKQLPNKKEQIIFIPQTKSSQQRKYICQTHFNKIQQQWDKQDIAKNLRTMPFHQKLTLVELMFGSDLIQKNYSQSHFMYSCFLRYLKKQKILTLKIRMTDLPQIKSIDNTNQKNKMQGINNYLTQTVQNQKYQKNQICSIIQSYKNPQFDIKIYRQMYQRISTIMQQLQRKHQQNLFEKADQRINLTNLSRNNRRSLMSQYQTMLRINRLKRIKGSEKNQRAQKLSERIAKIRQMFGNEGDQVVQNFEVKIKKRITKTYDYQQLQKTKINFSIILTDKIQQQHKKRKMNEQAHIAKKIINQMNKFQNIIDQINQLQQCNFLWILVVFLTIILLVKLTYPPIKIQYISKPVINYSFLYNQNLGYSPAISSLAAFIQAANYYY